MSTATVDVAFASAGLQLDQLCFWTILMPRVGNYYVRPFNRRLKGTNCPDFVNLPPVAGIKPGKEVYAQQYTYKMLRVPMTLTTSSCAIIMCTPATIATILEI